MDRAVAPFPFVVGCGRSGTTLLRAMLDSHPDLAVPPESHFIMPLAARAKRYGDRAPLAAARFASDLVAHPRFARWGVDPAAVHEAVRAAAPTVADRLRAAYRVYAAAAGKPRYGDKTPTYVRHLELLAGVFPEAVFVHIIRDGRDVALSLRDVEFGPNQLGRAALLWQRDVRAGRSAGQALAGRYHEVMYEDLVDDPESVLRRLCPPLGLTFDPAMLRYPERADHIVAGTFLPHRHAHVTEPPTRGLRDWRSQMTAEDVALFDALAGDLLGDLGYERPPTQAQGRPRGRAAVARVEALAGWPRSNVSRPAPVDHDRRARWDRVAVVGAPGSGKTRFAVHLARTASLPLHHVDDLYWYAGWSAAPRDDWRRHLERLVSEPRWIVEGHDPTTLEIHTGRAEAVVFFDLPPALSVAGVVQRIVATKLGGQRWLPAPIRELNQRQTVAGLMSVAAKAFAFRFRNRPAALRRLERLDAGTVVWVVSRREQADTLLDAFVVDDTADAARRVG